MPLFRRIASVLLILLGAVGVLAALTLIAGAWTYGRSAAARAERIVAGLDKTVAHLDAMAGKSIQQIGLAEDATTGLNGAVQLRAANAATAGADRSSRQFDEFERRAISGIGQVRDQLQSAAEAAGLVAELLELAESNDERSSSDTRRAAVAKLVAQIQAGRASIEQAAKSLEAMQTGLAGIRSDENVQQNAARIDRASRQISGKLREVKSYLEWVQEELKRTKSWLDTLRDKSGGWIRSAQIWLTLFAVWLGAAQLCMAIVGWRLWKGPALPSSSAAS